MTGISKSEHSPKLKTLALWCAVLIGIPVLATGVLIRQSSEEEELQKRSHTRHDLTYLTQGGEARMIDWTEGLQNAGLTKKEGVKWNFALKMFTANYVPRETGPAVAIFTPSGKGEVTAYVCEAQGDETYLFHTIDRQGKLVADDVPATTPRYAELCQRGFDEIGVNLQQETSKDDL